MSSALRADIFALAFETDRELLTEDALLRDLVAVLANSECLDLELKGPSKFIFFTEPLHFWSREISSSALSSS